MTDLVVDTFPIWKAVLWIFYPMAALVMVELLLRAFNDDNDDDDEGGGVMSPVYQTVPTGA
tara:strand:- start:61 stop:243 length:183 start_codon:yes stop_codon:yes gene_type:complete